MRTIVAQVAKPPEFGETWGTECLNTRVPSAYPAVCRIQCEADLTSLLQHILYIASRCILHVAR